MHVWDAVADGAIDFKKSSEPIAHVVENRLLQAALAKVAESLQSVEVFDKEKVESIESFDDRPVLTLASGIQIACDLLIGADGPNSKVREFAGIESVGLNYSQHGLVGTVLIEQCDNKAAWQRFLPSGPIALLPLSTTQSSIVWSLTGDLASRLVKLSPDNFCQLLNAAIHNPVQDVQFLLESIDKNGETTVDFASEAAWGRDRAGLAQTQSGAPWVVSVTEGSRAPFPLRMKHATTYSGHRVVLVGDAAHTVHPLAGQGLNLGLADSESLSRLLLQGIQNGQDIGSSQALSEYTAERYLHNAGMLMACDGLSRLFTNNNSVLAGLRSFGLGALNKSAGLKSVFMKIAS
ncbi:putative ubiquinone biosynthesis monooxygenase [Kappamyces sp. JEL0829]|nr:putative ubiquinone biosynthesis monooxygenase [Kappamyces sp. JEL0829]